MDQLIITSTSKDDLINEISALIDKKLSPDKHNQYNTRVSRLDLAKGNWSGGFKMTPPTQDKYRRKGLLKPIKVGGKIFYQESDLLNIGHTNKKRLNDGK